MDFVVDSFANGRKFRVLTVKDLFTHESIKLHVGRSITGLDVARELSNIGKIRGLPKAVICDNGTEYTSKAMDQWAFANNVNLNFNQPGKPMQNAFIENWRIEYNTDRPTKPLGMRTPDEFAKLFGNVV